MFCTAWCCGKEEQINGKDRGEIDADSKQPEDPSGLDGHAAPPTKRADDALADDALTHAVLEKDMIAGQAAMGRTLLEDMHDNSPSKNGVSFSSVSAPYSARDRKAYPQRSKDSITGLSDQAASSSGFLTARSLTTTAAGTTNPEFVVVIERAAGSSLGLNLDALDGQSLIISAVKAGPIRAYNEQQDDDDLMLQHGDSIVEVNGARGSSQALLERLKADSELTLSIKRPVAFTISIARAYAPLGLQVEHAPNGTSLLVKTVNPGLIKDWNLSHRGMGIKRRDRVKTVNGSQGNPAELMAKMKMAAVQGERLDIEVCRY
mmetsp:Transcript_61651/g.144570  ORF Transcript_61651/g.144570 Transcript_61651/m.144570 type:complete len:319 (-) Transcript_61651:67-1023(-)